METNIILLLILTSACVIGIFALTYMYFILSREFGEYQIEMKDMLEKEITAIIKYLKKI